MLWLFVGYHLWLIKKGYTTNEQSKEGQAGFFLERCVSFFEKWENFKKDSKKSDFKPSERTLEFYDIKANDLSLAEIQKKHKEAVSALTQLNKGSAWKPSSLWRGLLFIYFPDYYFGVTE